MYTILMSGIRQENDSAHFPVTKALQQTFYLCFINQLYYPCFLTYLVRITMT